MVGVLTHVNARFLLKFSGHRSLHLILPAEAFPESMEHQPSQRKWHEQASTLGRMLCRFVPPWTAGDVGKSSDLMLTAPYSLHRYNGLINLPLSITDAMNFDPSSATMESFQGVDWNPDLFDRDDGGVVSLFRIARRLEGEPEILQDLARDVFHDDRWPALSATMHVQEEDPLTRTIMTGLVAGPSWSGRTDVDPSRYWSALLAIDDPENKSMRLLRMFGGIGFIIPEELFLACRRRVARALAAWVRGGLESLWEHV
ncbi:unnamed protein product, partial [marine sediment metagenome]